MVSIRSEKKVVTKTVPNEGAVFDITYHGDDIVTVNPYWHVLSGWDHSVIGDDNEPAHLLGVVSESPYRELPDELIPGDLEVVATFDREPTREELDTFIPDNYQDHLTGER